MNTLDVSRFNHHKDSKTFTIEASDLGIRPPDRMPNQIPITNNKRNNLVVFEMVGREDDVEGDVMYWVYAPTVQSKIYFPKLNGYTLEVFND
jgi:hypothetical protein